MPEMPPPMMATEDTEEGLRMELANHLDYCLYILHRRFRQNAVTQVEDMAGPRTRPLEQFSHSHLEFRERREQRHGVEVALYSRAVADVHPGLIDIDAPVHPHHITTGGM